MTLSSLSPPLTPLKGLANSLRADGFAIVSANDVAQMAHVDLEQLQDLTQFWEGLPRDPYLRMAFQSERQDFYSYRIGCYGYEQSISS